MYSDVWRGIISPSVEKIRQFSSAPLGSYIFGSITFWLTAKDYAPFANLTPTRLTWKLLQARGVSEGAKYSTNRSYILHYPQSQFVVLTRTISEWAHILTQFRAAKEYVLIFIGDSRSRKVHLYAKKFEKYSLRHNQINTTNLTYNIIKSQRP